MCLCHLASMSHIKPRLFKEFKTIAEDEFNSCSKGNRRQPHNYTGCRQHHASSLDNMCRRWQYTIVQPFRLFSVFRRSFLNGQEDDLKRSHKQTLGSKNCVTYTCVSGKRQLLRNIFLWQLIFNNADGQIFGFFQRKTLRTQHFRFGTAGILNLTNPYQGYLKSSKTIPEADFNSCSSGNRRQPYRKMTIQEDDLTGRAPFE